MAAILPALPSADLLSDSLLCDMPLFCAPQERLFFELPENAVDSPPESPCYSTTMSDVSGDEFVDMVSPKEFSHDTMWGAAGHDLFLATSVAWIPDAHEADHEFDSLVHFTADDSIVAIEELHEPKAALMLPSASATPLPVVVAAEPKPASPLKRKASTDSDERPTKKSKTFSPATSPAPAASVAGSDQASATRDDPEAKRLTHNVLERRRRNDLKLSYQQLRLQIPTLEDNERAPTGQILIHAVEQITALKTEEQTLMAELAIARAENQRLRALHAN